MIPKPWLAAVALALASGPAFAEGACKGLADLRIESVNLHSAAEVPAAGDLPGYCRVLATLRPATSIEVRLPLRGWNGKLYQVGCGGFCGLLNSDVAGFTNAANFGLRRGYATATMDGGHWGTSVVDGRWAMNNPVAQADWGTRSTTETARVAKVLVKAFYGEPQRKAYFAGCSTGGRMAAMEALRFPKDFDGIIAGAPALDYTGLVATSFAWVTKANTGPNGQPILSSAKVKRVAEAVTAACSTGQDARIGLVGDPRACGFSPAALRCQGPETAECLTEAEVGVIEKWYAGPSDAAGRRLYPGGVPKGSEIHWPRWLTGAGNASPLLPLFARDFLRYMAFQPAAGPAFQVADFDFETDPARTAVMAPVYNAATFTPGTGKLTLAGDLAPFRQAGGKLLLYHGWADPLVVPGLTVAFYEALAEREGGYDRLGETARLFMVPGMDHCGIGTEGPGIGDTGIDPLTALERWVEGGEAPASLIATKTAAPGGPVLWSRPVCPYPQVARHDGSGDPAAAASYSCAAP
ncbi:tannase/feruloyl esterase family alpha/beta hydrolase [Methylobacterium oryzisoli]|uniref:tannase/feruloyl esterase family alpha/beta hydrolase n=1 Tax=Methylobacterium oryzisoli TaxID=3385502 RepID=UPI003892C4BC